MNAPFARRGRRGVFHLEEAIGATTSPGGRPLDPMANKRMQNSARAEDAGRQAGEYVVIAGEFGRYFLSRREGARVADVVTRWWTPRWLEFEDLSGSIVRVRSRDVNDIFDMGPEIRRAMRAFGRAHEREERADCHPWDDEE
jgi:hypothetical protein